MARLTRRAFISATTLMLLSACSGSGGGGGSFAAYHGVTAAADITTNNILLLIDAAMSEPQGFDIVQGFINSGSASGPIPCDSGSGNATVNLNGNGEGTMQVSFNNCSFVGVSLSGSFSATLGGFDATFGTTTSSVTMNISMTVSNIQSALTGTVDTVIDPNLGQITSTADMVATTNLSPVTIKWENYVTVKTVPDLSVPDEISAVSYSGKVYLSDLGFIDVTTSPGLTYTNVSQFFPDGGGPMTVTGQGNESAEVLPLSSNDYQLSLDADGDTVFESVNTIPW